jgi:hypothetical protein
MFQNVAAPDTTIYVYSYSFVQKFVQGGLHRSFSSYFLGSERSFKIPTGFAMTDTSLKDCFPIIHSFWVLLRCTMHQVLGQHVKQ